MARRFRYLTRIQIDRDPAVPIPTWRLCALGYEWLTRADWTTVLLGTDGRHLLQCANQGPGNGERHCRCVAGANAGLARNARSRSRPHGSCRTRGHRCYLGPVLCRAGAQRARLADGRRCTATHREIGRSGVGRVSAPGCALRGSRHSGALLYCHWAGHTISGEHRQSEEGGNLFGFVPRSRKLEFCWIALKDVPVRQETGRYE